MRVFVSSTVRDLAQYRDIIRLALQTSGHSFLGMEHFAAQSFPPLDVCLSELDTADVYVGVIGDNYGSCPPGQKKSYTELEYLHAVERNLDCLIFIIRDDALVEVGSHDHDPHRHALLTQFRDALMRDHTVNRFSNPHEAAWEVLAALRVTEMRQREDHANGAHP